MFQKLFPKTENLEKLLRNIDDFLFIQKALYLFIETVALILYNPLIFDFNKIRFFFINQF